MNKLIQYSAKLSLAGAVAVALLVLGDASILAPAFATHDPNHDEIARGKIGALEERVWSCENDRDPCKSIVGDVGAEGPIGPKGPQGEQGPTGNAGFDGPLAILDCSDGQTVAWDNTIGGFVCSEGGDGGPAAAHFRSHAHDHIVFVTSTTYTGDLVTAALALDEDFEGSGVDAANAICASHAGAGVVTRRIPSLDRYWGWWGSRRDVLSLHRRDRSDG